MRSERWRRFRAVAREHVGGFVTNWHDYDASLPTKLGLTARNRLKATFSIHQCCGHGGQPGC
jgi:hypothetical protein